MKRIVSLILLLIMTLTCFVACDNSTGNTGVGSGSGSGTGSTNTPPSNVAVTAVTLSSSTISMTLGEKKSISATVMPSNATDKKLTWSSSNSAVAEYVNGQILALAEGSCVIKATSSNGIVGSCIVTVNRPATLAQTVSFTSNSIYLGVGEERYDTLTITPSQLDSYKGTITSSDSSVIRATYSGDSQAKVMFYPQKAGTATITITLEGGATTSTTVTVIDAKSLVKVNLPTLPKTLSSYFSSGKVCTSASILSIELSYLVVDKNTIHVTLTIKGKKTYDYEGSQSDYGVDYKLSLYKENNVFCRSEKLYSLFLFVGEEFTNTYTFGVAIDDDMTPREFTIVLENYQM